MSAYTHDGQVYFVACDKYVKIGYTSQPIAKRLPALRAKALRRPADMNISAPLRVLRLIPSCVIRDERRIHGLFAAHHAEGEWYRLTPAFLVQLQRLQYVTYREGLAEFRRCRREFKQARARRVAA